MLDKNNATGHSMAHRGGRLRKGQSANANAIARTHKQGGEHDLSQVRLEQAVLDRIKQNIGEGWKTEYKPEYAVIALEMLSKENQCWTLRLLCAVLGCSEATLFKWIEKHDQFAQAIAYGKSVQEVHFGNILLQGFKYSRSVEYVLANLHDWTQKKEERHGVIDLNKEIAEREAFVASHRATKKKIDWRDGDVIDVTPIVKPITDKNKDITHGESRGEGIKEQKPTEYDTSSDTIV